MAMLYDIQHVTTCDYDAAIASSYCALRMLPRCDRGQTVLQSGLVISPLPAEEHERVDFFGNRTVDIRIDVAHRELQVGAHARVAVDRASPPVPALTLPWESVREHAVASASLEATSP